GHTEKESFKYGSCNKVSVQPSHLQVDRCIHSETSTGSATNPQEDPHKGEVMQTQHQEVFQSTSNTSTL
ncbi:hypothetical protein HispidOSU_014967, partial [Sigmodon hispidus]